MYKNLILKLISKTIIVFEIMSVQRKRMTLHRFQNYLEECHDCSSRK